MRRMTLAAAFLMFALAPTPARAQSWEVSGFVGVTPSAALDRRAPELDEVNYGGGFTWGAQVGRLFTSHLAAEALWSEQASALQIGTADGTANLFTITVQQFHGDAVYHVGRAGARLQPFAFVGLGATFLSAIDLPSETKLSWGLGGGVKYFPWEGLGLRAHFRYKPTMLDDEDAGDFCDPFGFCQGTLQQIEIAAGGVVRF